MADVQLKYGYMRIANALHQAMITAPFSPIQRQIMGALAQLTYGWNRLTFEGTESELARYASVQIQGRASGGFRTALAELVEHGPVRRLRAGSRGVKPVWALQKDFEQWGRFSVADASLFARWGTRPAHCDGLMRSIDHPDHDQGGGGNVGNESNQPATNQTRANDEGASGEAPSALQNPASGEATSMDTASGEASKDVALGEATNAVSVSTEGDAALAKATSGLGEGRIDSSKSFNDETYEAGKTGKTVVLTTLLPLPRARANELASTEARTADDDTASGEATLVEEPRDLALLDRFPRWPQLRSKFASEAQIAAVGECLLRAGDEALSLIPALINWLDHDMIPPLYAAKITPVTVAAALQEYRKGNYAIIHVWSFVRNMIDRFEELAGSGDDGGLSGAAERLLHVGRRAAALWLLIKREGLLGGSPEITRQRIEELAADGAIADAPAFLRFLAALPRAQLDRARTDHYAEEIVSDTLIKHPVTLPTSHSVAA
jgi:hypothetical protein